MILIDFCLEHVQNVYYLAGKLKQESVLPSAWNTKFVEELGNHPWKSLAHFISNRSEDFKKMFAFYIWFQTSSKILHCGLSLMLGIIEKKKHQKPHSFENFIAGFSCFLPSLLGLYEGKSRCMRCVHTGNRSCWTRYKRIWSLHWKLLKQEEKNC